MSVSALPFAGPSASAVLAAVEADLADGDLSGYEGLSAEESTDVVLRWRKVEARVTAHLAAATRAVHASGAASRAGASSTASHLAHQFGGNRHAAASDVHLAQQLEKAARVEQALAGGAINKEQAALVARTVSDLPATISDEARAGCEVALIEDAQHLSIRDLRHRADRITDVFKPAPEVDRYEGAAVAARERSAYERAQLWMKDHDDGTVSGGFTLPEAVAGRLRNALDGFAAPRRRRTDAAQADDDLTWMQRQGRALVALVEHLPTDGLPDAGGSGLVVTVNLDVGQLVDGIGTGRTSTGQRMSAGDVRREACRVGVVPQVLGGASVPLDLGRTQRLFSRAQRLALAHRDQGCAFPDCDRPPSWTETHHAREPWSHGGGTDLEDGVLLCPFHHRQVHHDGWSITFETPGRYPGFIPPTRLDPHRRPRTHARYRP
ncbi:MAG: DUF222 domain-containing protein [Nocardioidaceae bacterium]|nr:DUF222 domain-containing protein [Nocardioidaceae bacterium]